MSALPPTDTTAMQVSQQPLTRAWLVGFALIASAVLGTVLYLDPADQDAPAPVVENAVGPDLEITDAIISRYRETGKLQYRLRSPLIEHFTDRGITYLDAPDLTLHGDPEPPWQIIARKGTISSVQQREETVLLEDDVSMTQTFPDGRNYRLETPAITIYPGREYAETNRDVMITTHAGRTRAVGLKGSLDQGLLELFSTDEQRVHTVILPDQFKAEQDSD